MTDTTIKESLADELLDGAQEIAEFMYGDDPAAVRRVYHLRHKLPIFNVDGSSILYALKSQLRAHMEARGEQRAAQIAAAAAAAQAAEAVSPRRARRRKRPQALGRKTFNLS
jgi:hypothetical protein